MSGPSPVMTEEDMRIYTPAHKLIHRYITVYGTNRQTTVRLNSEAYPRESQLKTCKKLKTKTEIGLNRKSHPFRN